MIRYTYAGIVFEADDLEDLEELATQSPAIMKAVKAIEQAGIAAEVFAAKGSDATPNVHGQASSGPGGVPRCAHGPMNDLRGKKNKKGESYKFEFYCPADFNDNSRCNPSGRNG